MDDEGGLVVLLLHPVGPIADVAVVAVAIPWCDRAGPRRGKLHVTEKRLKLFPGLSSRQLDANDARLQHLGDLGALELRRLGDDGQAVVARAENGVDESGGVDPAMFILDVEKVEAGLLVKLDDGGSDVLGEHAADQHIAAPQSAFEMASWPAFGIEGSVVRIRNAGHFRHDSFSQW